MKDQGFKLPDNYFEETKLRLKDIALESSASPETNSAAVARGHKLRWTSISLAAAAVLLLSFFLFQPDTPPAPNSDLNYSELNEQEIIHFLSEDPSVVFPESFMTLSSEEALNEEGLLEDEALDSELIDAYLSEQYLSNEYL